MSNDRYPRANVRVNASGELLLTVLHKGFYVTFIFMGTEVKRLDEALNMAQENPGQEYVVAWDETKREDR